MRRTRDQPHSSNTARGRAKPAATARETAAPTHARSAGHIKTSWVLVVCGSARATGGTAWSSGCVHAAVGLRRVQRSVITLVTCSRMAGLAFIHLTPILTPTPTTISEQSRTSHDQNEASFRHRRTKTNASEQNHADLKSAMFNREYCYPLTATRVSSDGDE
jgi:hypothetical protein